MLKDRLGDLQVQVSIQVMPSSAVSYVVDIDEKSLQFAKQNVQSNNLQGRIKLLQTQSNDPLLPLDKMRFERFAQSFSLDMLLS